MHILIMMIYCGALRPGWKMKQYEPDTRRVLKLLIQILKVTYTYRTIPKSTEAGPGFIRLCDGDPIILGKAQRQADLGRDLSQGSVTSSLQWLVSCI